MKLYMLYFLLLILLIAPSLILAGEQKTAAPVPTSAVAMGKALAARMMASPSSPGLWDNANLATAHMTDLLKTLEQEAKNTSKTLRENSEKMVADTQETLKKLGAAATVASLGVGSGAHQAGHGVDRIGEALQKLADGVYDLPKTLPSTATPLAITAVSACAGIAGAIHLSKENYGPGSAMLAASIGGIALAPHTQDNPELTKKLAAVGLTIGTVATVYKVSKGKCIIQ